MDALPIDPRVGRPADAATIAALSVQVFLDTYATAGVRPDLAREAFHEYSVEAFSRRLAEAGRLFILAEAGEALVGFVELLETSRPALDGNIEGAEIVRLYVQPQAQGRGIGTTLDAAAERAAACSGARWMWLTAWEANARALAFYARQGYADVGSAAYTFEGRAYTNRVLARSVAR